MDPHILSIMPSRRRLSIWLVCTCEWKMLIDPDKPHSGRLDVINAQALRHRRDAWEAEHADDDA